MIEKVFFHIFFGMGSGSGAMLLLLCAKKSEEITTKLAKIKSFMDEEACNGRN